MRFGPRTRWFAACLAAVLAVALRPPGSASPSAWAAFQRDTQVANPVTVVTDQALVEAGYQVSTLRLLQSLPTIDSSVTFPKAAELPGEMATALGKAVGHPVNAADPNAVNQAHLEFDAKFVSSIQIDANGRLVFPFDGTGIATLATGPSPVLTLQPPGGLPQTVFNGVGDQWTMPNATSNFQVDLGSSFGYKPAVVHQAGGLSFSGGSGTFTVSPRSDTPIVYGDYGGTLWTLQPILGSAAPSAASAPRISQILKILEPVAPGQALFGGAPRTATPPGFLLWGRTPATGQQGAFVQPAGNNAAFTRIIDRIQSNRDANAYFHLYDIQMSAGLSALPTIPGGAAGGQTGRFSLGADKFFFPSGGNGLIDWNAMRALPRPGPNSHFFLAQGDLDGLSARVDERFPLDSGVKWTLSGSLSLNDGISHYVQTGGSDIYAHREGAFPWSIEDLRLTSSLGPGRVPVDLPPLMHELGHTLGLSKTTTLRDDPQTKAARDVARLRRVGFGMAFDPSVTPAERTETTNAMAGALSRALGHVVIPGDVKSMEQAQAEFDTKFGPEFHFSLLTNLPGPRAEVVVPWNGDGTATFLGGASPKLTFTPLDGMPFQFSAAGDTWVPSAAFGALGPRDYGFSYEPIIQHSAGGLSFSTGLGGTYTISPYPNAPILFGNVDGLSYQIPQPFTAGTKGYQILEWNLGPQRFWSYDQTQSGLGSGAGRSQGAQNFSSGDWSRMQALIRSNSESNAFYHFDSRLTLGGRPALPPAPPVGGPSVDGLRLFNDTRIDFIPGLAPTLEGWAVRRALVSRIAARHHEEFMNQLLPVFEKRFSNQWSFGTNLALNDWIEHVEAGPIVTPSLILPHSPQENWFTDDPFPAPPQSFASGSMLSPYWDPSARRYVELANSILNGSLFVNNAPAVCAGQNCEGGRSTSACDILDCVDVASALGTGSVWSDPCSFGSCSPPTLPGQDEDGDEFELSVGVIENLGRNDGFDLWQRLVKTVRDLAASLGGIEPVLSAQTGVRTPPVELYLTSLGVSSGEAFHVDAINNGPRPVRLSGGGIVLEPLAREAQALVRERLARFRPGASNIATTTLNAYCLDFAKNPPTAGTIYRAAPAAKQAQHSSLRRIMRAASQLAQEGQLKPDAISDAGSYVTATKQWAIWSRVEKWGEKQFTDAFVERTRKNLIELKQKWDKDTEKAVRSLVPGRWRHVQAVLTAGDRLVGR